MEIEAALSRTGSVMKLGSSGKVRSKSLLDPSIEKTQGSAAKRNEA